MNEYKRPLFKGFGGFLLKLMIVFGVLSIAICQLEFDINIRMTKKKTGIIQSITNIADSVYSGYTQLTKGGK